MSWVVTVTYHCRIVDEFICRDEARARDIYAECLVRYSSEYEVSLTKEE